jgi:hypothetical protein
MKTRTNFVAFVVAVAIAGVILTSPTGSYANHSWQGYHWARTSNPFTIRLGDNVSSVWDPYLTMSSSDWNASSVMNTLVVGGSGTSARKCSPTLGRVELCNTTYGRTQWLGIASIWASGSHITQGTVKMNDTYYAMAQYNTPAWRQMVMCQEVGHTFGLDHQDENFSNTNLGTCMDYTNDPDGGGSYGASNLHPNTHDYDQLETIYAHLDNTTTVGTAAAVNGQDIDTNDPGQWGRAVAFNNAGRGVRFERDLGNGVKLFTFVFWAEAPRHDHED